MSFKSKMPCRYFYYCMYSIAITEFPCKILLSDASGIMNENGVGRGNQFVLHGFINN